MLKKNVMMIIPQTVIMSWISFFFSGFVLSMSSSPLMDAYFLLSMLTLYFLFTYSLARLPFPLTLRFKAMLQSGIETSDMGVEWYLFRMMHILKHKIGNHHH